MSVLARLESAASRALVLLLVILATLCLSGAVGASESVEASSPIGLTAQGRLLSNFEALLRTAFGTRAVFASRGENFSCAGACAPLSTYSRYWFVFKSPARSTLHLSKRKFGSEVFGNYPAPVLIRGQSIACDLAATRFLVVYRNAASFTLGCLAPMHP